jgi:RimJ/RimL family protein N-acetyltransferase
MQTVPIIATNRLILRSASNSDLDQLYDIVFSDPEVMSQAFEGKPLSRKQAADFFASSFDRDGNGMQLGVLTLKGAGAVIGFAGLLESTTLGKQDFEIGFVLGRAFWGRGYATEIGLAQIEYGLVQKKCTRLLAFVSPKNETSKSALLKIGMQHHSTLETSSRGMRDVYIVYPTFEPIGKARR